MARLMADEKQVLRDKNMQRQDWMKHQESTLIRKIKANTDIVEKKATDVHMLYSISEEGSIVI